LWFLLPLVKSFSPVVRCKNKHRPLSKLSEVIGLLSAQIVFPIIPLTAERQQVTTLTAANFAKKLFDGRIASNALTLKTLHG
jgi:hypothetical protein